MYGELFPSTLVVVLSRRLCSPLFFASSTLFRAFGLLPCAQTSTPILSFLRPLRIPCCFYTHNRTGPHWRPDGLFFRSLSVAFALLLLLVSIASSFGSCVRVIVQLCFFSVLHQVTGVAACLHFITAALVGVFFLVTFSLLFVFLFVCASAEVSVCRLHKVPLPCSSNSLRHTQTGNTQQVESSILRFALLPPLALARSV